MFQLFRRSHRSRQAPTIQIPTNPFNQFQTVTFRPGFTFHGKRCIVKATGYLIAGDECVHISIEGLGGQSLTPVAHLIDWETYLRQQAQAM